MKLKSVTLKNNLKILEKVYNDLAKKIENAKKEKWIEVVQSENKMPNLLINTSGKIDTAYDTKNPRSEANITTKQLSLYKDEITIIIGAGLGYIVKSILDKMEKGHHIILIEPNFYLLKLFLSHYNYEKYLSNGSLIICASRDDFLYVSGTLEQGIVIDGYLIIIERYVRKRKEYNELIKLASDVVNQTRSNTGTVMGSGHEMAYNDIKSLPYLIRRRGVIELKDLYKKYPAVIVSTGPSLSKNIHVLKKYQNKSIIICVAQALRILLSYDIKPDFACSVDFGETNLGHYSGLMDCNIPLVLLNRTYSEIAKRYKGPIFTVGTWCPGYENTIFGLMEKKGLLAAGGSVAHMCFSLADHLGCEPIILTGQDLALTGNKSHFNQTDESGEIIINEDGAIDWKVTDHRSHLIEKGIEFSMGAAVYVKGYFGSPVLTNTGLVSFITSFEQMIKDYTNNMDDK